MCDLDLNCNLDLGCDMTVETGATWTISDVTLAIDASIIINGTFNATGTTITRKATDYWGINIDDATDYSFTECYISWGENLGSVVINVFGNYNVGNNILTYMWFWGGHGSNPPINLILPFPRSIEDVDWRHIGAM